MHATPGPSKPLPALAVAFAVLVWGGSFVAARHLVKPADPALATLDPVTLAAARFAFASLFFAAPFGIALIRGRLGLRDLLRMAFLGQLAFSVYFWLQYTGVRNTNAGIAAILAVGLLPIATALLAPLGGERRPSGFAWAALVLGALGVAAIARDRPAGDTGGGDFLVGALCLVGNAVAFAIYSLLNRRWMRDVPPVTMTGGSMILGTLGLLLMNAAAPGAGGSSLGALAPSQWAALAFLSLGCSVGGYLAWTYALRHVEARRATVWIYAEPVVAVTLGGLVLGERIGPLALAGTAAIALSVALAGRRPRPAADAS